MSWVEIKSWTIRAGECTLHQTFPSRDAACIWASRAMGPGNWQAVPTAQGLFDAALARIESKSIRDWASGEHNRGLIISAMEQRKLGKDDPDAWAAWLVCVAIGA